MHHMIVVVGFEPIHIYSLIATSIYPHRELKPRQPGFILLLDPKPSQVSSSIFSVGEATINQPRILRV
jgi:hypothetical protein